LLHIHSFNATAVERLETNDECTDGIHHASKSLDIDLENCNLNKKSIDSFNVPT